MNQYNDIDQIRTTAKQPPAAIEVEKAVIGSVLIDNQVIPRVIEILKPENFYDVKHQFIYEAIISLFESNEPVDTITLYNELRKTGKINEVGGVEYLGRLSNEVSSAANVDYHAKIILEKSILRKLISTTGEIATMAYAGEEDVFDLLDAAESKIFQISDDGYKESYQSMDKAVKQAIEHIESIHSKDLSKISVPSGLYELDSILGGFQKTDLIILAARPAMGKTAFALSVARNAAVDHKIPVAIFSLEMATLQLVVRLICSEAKINAHSVRTGTFKPEEGQKISKTAHKLIQSPIYIDDTPGQTVLEIRAKCRRLKAERNIGLIIIDYLQLMSSSGRMESREREISTISRSLKGLAKELNVPIIALSQLNRAVESRNDKRPMLSDLRESGSIEQDADNVLFLYRPEVYGITTDAEGNSTQGTGEVIVAKQRNGPTGIARVRFIAEYARYDNLDHFYSGFEEKVRPSNEDYPI